MMMQDSIDTPYGVIKIGATLTQGNGKEITVRRLYILKPSLTHPDEGCKINSSCYRFRSIATNFIYWSRSGKTPNVAGMNDIVRINGKLITRNSVDLTNYDDVPAWPPLSSLRPNNNKLLLLLP